MMHTGRVRPFVETDLEGAPERFADAWQELYDWYREQIGDTLFSVFFDNWLQKQPQELHRLMRQNHQAKRACALLPEEYQSGMDAPRRSGAS